MMTRAQIVRARNRANFAKSRTLPNTRIARAVATEKLSTYAIKQAKFLYIHLISCHLGFWGFGVLGFWGFGVLGLPSNLRYCFFGLLIICE